jgi:glucose-6-phosphate 1-dehydrogenase
MHINSPRWEGVPFILKAGKGALLFRFTRCSFRLTLDLTSKALNEQKTEIRIQYKDVTQGIFAEITRNELVIRVQPGEAVYLKMNSKAPGLSMRTVPTEMDLTYKRRFCTSSFRRRIDWLITDIAYSTADLKIPEAYE